LSAHVEVGHFGDSVMAISCCLRVHETRCDAPLRRRSRPLKLPCGIAARVDVIDVELRSVSVDGKLELELHAMSPNGKIADRARGTDSGPPPSSVRRASRKPALLHRIAGARTEDGVVHFHDTFRHGHARDGEASRCRKEIPEPYARGYDARRVNQEPGGRQSHDTTIACLEGPRYTGMTDPGRCGENERIRMTASRERDDDQQMLRVDEPPRRAERPSAPSEPEGNPRSEGPRRGSRRAGHARRPKGR
jgi:hypothetical protein